MIGKSENPYEPSREKHGETPRRKKKAKKLPTKVVSRVIFGFVAVWFLVVLIRVVVGLSNQSGLGFHVVGVLPVLLLVAVTLFVLYRNAD
jgi:hypothetical protein